MNRREFLGIAVAGAFSLAQVAASESTRTEPAEGVRRFGRHRENFNANWLFKRQAHGGGELGSRERNPFVGAEIEPAFLKAMLPDYDDGWWEPIYLPHTWNAHDGGDDIPVSTGTRWRARLSLPFALQRTSGEQ